ncbi:MAG: aminotransferase class IV [Saprospiraceae bacterium]|nr:aminotransferase class IV [Saprospiraceae bacterium]
MIQYYHINGELTPVAEAQLHVTDLAIMRGYGVFDYFRALQGRALFVEDYVQRFFNSAKLLQLEVPCSQLELRQNIQQLLDKNGEDKAGIRLILTGGYTTDSYTPVKPNLLILQHPYASYAAEAYERGIKMLTYEYRREIPVAKTINYVTGIRIQKWLKENGADAVLYYDNDIIKESDRSNFFLIDQAGKLVTPEADVLPGITRMKVIQVAKELGLPVEERTVQLNEIFEAKEAFITSSIKGVLPVTYMDDKAIGTGQVGDISKQLGAAFEALVERYVMAKT